MSRHDVDQMIEDWRQSIPKLRGGVIGALTEALEANARPRELQLLSAEMEEGWARIAFRGRPWGLRAIGEATPYAQEWRIELHDLTGPVQRTGHPGQQEPGSVLYKTAPFSSDWIHHAALPLLNWLRAEQPTEKHRFAGALPKFTLFFIAEHEVWAEPARDYSPAIVRFTVSVRGEVWTLYCTRHESRKAAAFLAWLLLGYDPPDGLLQLELSGVGDMRRGLATSCPATWSRWRDSQLWSLHEVWTVAGAAQYQHSRE